MVPFFMKYMHVIVTVKLLILLNSTELYFAVVVRKLVFTNDSAHTVWLLNYLLMIADCLFRYLKIITDCLSVHVFTVYHYNLI